MARTKTALADVGRHEQALARTDAIMTRRAAGASVRSIADGMGLEYCAVKKTIENRRAAGDPRALTSIEADRVRVSHTLAVSIERDEARDGARRVEAEKVRSLAGRLAPFGLAAVQGVHHLADLYEHCPHLYPQMIIRGSVAVLSTPRPPCAYASAQSPALACILAG